MNSSQQRAFRALQIGPMWLPRPDAPATPMSSQAPAQPDLADDLISLAREVSQCQRCGLCKSRRQTVFGVGTPKARVMVVGEAPGQEEDAQGEPFVGQAGKLLDNMLAAIGLARTEQVYIANVLKCRPPANRNPEPAEVASCEPFLQRQIELVAPELIVVMGRFAAHTLLQTDASIANLRGRVHRYRSANQNIPLVVTYHPAYLLRTLSDKAKSWSDLLVVKQLLSTTMAETSV